METTNHEILRFSWKPKMCHKFRGLLVEGRIGNIVVLPRSVEKYPKYLREAVVVVVVVAVDVAFLALMSAEKALKYNWLVAPNHLNH